MTKKISKTVKSHHIYLKHENCGILCNKMADESARCGFIEEHPNGIIYTDRAC